MELLDRNKTDDIIKIPNRCPICHPESGKGVLCETHEVLIHDYDMLRGYINNLDISLLNGNILYLLDNAIGNRVSYVISAHEKHYHKRLKVINGKLAIEEYLKEKLDDKIENGKEATCSVWMQTILLEILALRKAKCKIIVIFENDRIGDE